MAERGLLGGNRGKGLLFLFDGPVSGPNTIGDNQSDAKTQSNGDEEFFEREAHRRLQGTREKLNKGTRNGY